MNRQQQRRFVRELSRNIASSVCQQIDNGKIPLHWDGHEFRCLLAERHEQSAMMSLLRQYPRCSRARDYKNIVITHNL